MRSMAKDLEMLEAAKSTATATLLPVFGERSVLSVMLSESVVVPSNKKPTMASPQSTCASPCAARCEWSLLAMLTMQPKNEPRSTSVASLKELLVTETTHDVATAVRAELT